ncbi:MAG: glutamine synthetase family protein [Faecalibacterium sp.]|nr:glutamine synthetase family protein [Ruminococcus flavefaciens]MCM1391696.1 glutamine synthetase family protein [Ruminococcus sp.]MCM1484648.1 glutamine synthetase family protein [Faecalibacterium sp.]
MGSTICENNVFLNFTNIYGTNIGKFISQNRLNRIAIEPVSFACVRSDGLGNSPNEEDLIVKPCTKNALMIPVRDKSILWVPCSLLKKDQEHLFCPRTILKKAIDSLTKIGIEIEIGFETEFYLLNEDLSYSVKREPKISAFNLQGTLSAYDYLSRLNELIIGANIDATSIVHEGGKSQFEFSFKHCSPIKAVDQLIAFKIIAKELAREHNLVACFMPKLCDNNFGSSTQINFSIKNKPQSVQLNAIAGIMKHVSAIMAFTCPTINSYKRFTNVSGSIDITWAPTKISYGYDNRSALIRYVTRDNRIEYRASDFSGNMYLSLASILISVFDGINNSLLPPEPLKQNIFNKAAKNLDNLPFTLFDAIMKLKNDEYILNKMGKEFCIDYIWNKENEWNQEIMHVSDEERYKYFDI